MDAQGRTKQSLIEEAEDIDKSFQAVAASRRYSHAPIELRLQQLENWVAALLASRVDDLRERAAMMPDATPQKDT